MPDRRITNEVMYEKIKNIHHELHEIKELVKKQNGRIRKLENWRNLFTGGICVLTFLVSAGLIKLFGG